MKKILTLVCTFLVGLISLAQDNQEPKVVWITLDGLRWQELFGGADSLLLTNKNFVGDTTSLKKLYGGKTRKLRREILMPFIWNTAIKEGVIYGNRWKGSKFNLTNGMHFSYPGYNEILCGFADDKNISSNNKIYNPNVTLLEKINQKKEFKGTVLAFGSWDVFPYIINDKRSGIPVNAGYSHALSDKTNIIEELLNKIQDETPKRWGGVRFDVFTHNYALEAMKNYKPRLIYIAYGETDDFAHDGKYDAYLKSTNRTDQFIKELWEYVQSDDFYKNQTTFIITTDHGRGIGVKDSNSWRHHGATIKGCDETWLIAFGNKIPKKGMQIKNSQHYTNQIARTVANLLEVEINDSKMGDPIKF